MNESQSRAINNVLSDSYLSIIHGPPGTGKTTTVVEAVSALLKDKASKILVTAPSNAAVDLLSEKLSEKGISVLRIGNPVRVSDRLQRLTLEEKVALHPMSKDIKKLRIQANEYRKLAHKYKRNFGKSEREQRKALFNEAHKILDEVDKTEAYINENVFASTQVVAATLVGCSQSVLVNLKFDAVIIDEAGQALEPACWIPILKSEKLILAGDHFQLPPTIKSDRNSGLNETLLEKLSKLRPEAVTMLDTQYRMNEKICGFSSKVFYGNKLKSDSSVANGQLSPETSPILFIDTAGFSLDEKQEGTSISNMDEAAFLIKRAEEMLEGFENLSIGIISPYKQQIKYLEEFFSVSEVLKRQKVDISTVDSFQGQERDAVFISITRSNPNGEIGFLADTRRVNVAMTRAKKLLVLVGDSATISNSDFYASLIDYMQENDAYKSAWEY